MGHRAHRVKDRHDERLIAQDGIEAVAAEGDVIVVTIASAAYQSRVPAALEGVPIRTEIDRVTFDSYQPPQEGYYGPYRPQPLGTNLNSGTAGFLLTDGENYFQSSNYHVLQDEASSGEQYYDPEVFAPGERGGMIRIGTVAGDLPWGDGARGVDVSWYRSDGAPFVNYLLEMDAVPEGPTYSAREGDTIMKTGWRTGVVSGSVESTNATVNFGTEAGDDRVFRDCLKISPGGWSDGGDSGSPAVVRDSQGRHRPTALGFASGSTYAYAIKQTNIEQRSGLETVTGALLIPGASDYEAPSEAEDIRQRTDLEFSTPGSGGMSRTLLYGSLVAAGLYVTREE